LDEWAHSSSKKALVTEAAKQFTASTASFLNMVPAKATDDHSAEDKR